MDFCPDFVIKVLYYSFQIKKNYIKNITRRRNEKWKDTNTKD